MLTGLTVVIILQHIYTNMESSHCTPEINTMLCQWEKKKKSAKRISMRMRKGGIPAPLSGRNKMLGLDRGQAPETYLMVLAWLSAQLQYG